MAKICPLTDHPVLYLTCLECDKKDECEDMRKEKNDSENKDTRKYETR